MCGKYILLSTINCFEFNRMADLKCVSSHLGVWVSSRHAHNKSNNNKKKLARNNDWLLCLIEEKKIIKWNHSKRKIVYMSPLNNSGLRLLFNQHFIFFSLCSAHFTIFHATDVFRLNRLSFNRTKHIETSLQSVSIQKSASRRWLYNLHLNTITSS